MSALQDAVAGAVAAWSTAAVFYPLDAQKTRLQAARDETADGDADGAQGGGDSGSSMLEVDMHVHAQPTGQGHAGSTDRDQNGWMPARNGASPLVIAKSIGNGQDRAAGMPNNGSRSTRKRALRDEGGADARDAGDLLTLSSLSRPFLALYRGFGAKSLHAILSSFAYFFLYAWLKGFYLRRMSRHGAHAQAQTGSLGVRALLVLSSLAAAGNVLCTLPIDVITTRVQTASMGKERVRTRDVIRAMMRTPSQLWSGLTPSLLLCVNPAVQFTVFDRMKGWLLAKRQREALAAAGSAAGTVGAVPAAPSSLGMADAFFVGMLAKFVATILTYPLIRVKVLMMADNVDDHSMETGKPCADITSRRQKPSMVQLLLRLGRSKKGVASLFQGLEAQLLLTVLKSAFLLATKERLHRLIVRNTTT